MSGKVKNMEITQAFLDHRAAHSVKKGYKKQRWVEFCETMLAEGLTVHLYEARKTFSKYLTVSRGKRRFRVRYSNHRPNNAKELAGDCDFFVGVTNTGTRTTEDAIQAVFNFFDIHKETSNAA